VYRALKVKDQQQVESGEKSYWALGIDSLCRSEWKCGTNREGGEAISRCRDVKEIQEALGASLVRRVLRQRRRPCRCETLEAKAVLSLLEKLDRIRAAPMQFDLYLQQHRIGTAVITVAQALNTIFSSDVAQVQALIPNSTSSVKDTNTTASSKKMFGGGRFGLWKCLASFYSNVRHLYLREARKQILPCLANVLTSEVWL
jgi:hypothetical protein